MSTGVCSAKPLSCSSGIHTRREEVLGGTSTPRINFEATTGSSSGTTSTGVATSSPVTVSATDETASLTEDELASDEAVSPTSGSTATVSGTSCAGTAEAVEEDRDDSASDDDEAGAEEDASSEEATTTRGGCSSGITSPRLIFSTLGKAEDAEARLAASSVRMTSVPVAFSPAVSANSIPGEKSVNNSTTRVS